MRHLFYLHNLPLPDKVAAQKKKIKNKIPARLYIYFPYGEISKKKKKKLMGIIIHRQTLIQQIPPQQTTKPFVVTFFTNRQGKFV